MISSIKIPFQLIIAVLIISTHADADDFKIVKERVVNELMKTNVDDRQVENILSRMKADGSFQDINYEDLSRTAGFPHGRHTLDLVYLAKAYKSKTSQ